MVRGGGSGAMDDAPGSPGSGGGGGVSMLGSARCQAGQAVRALVGAGKSEAVACRRGGLVTRLLDGHSLQGRQATVAAAAATLQEGNLVALPTDTIYGVACLVQNSRALEAIYRLKGRAMNKPLAICLADVEQIYRYCSVRVPDELLQDLLPGPVTLVLERSEALNKDLNPFTPLVGVRIPNHWFVRELARACGSPLALTSANISNQTSALTVTEFQELWPHLSLIIDGGPIGDVQSPECRMGSTVIDLSVPGKFKIIRTGCALTSTLDILMTKYGLKSDLPAL